MRRAAERGFGGPRSVGAGSYGEGMSIEIRRASPAEHQAIGQLTVRAYRPSGMPADDPYYGFLRDVESRAADTEFWVAVDERGTLLGAVGWCPPDAPDREIGGPDDAEFRSLAVDPAHQGRGAGRALVAWCVERARAEGRRRVVLSSAEWMTTAHGLYERLGFTRTPAADWSPRPGMTLRTYELLL